MSQREATPVFHSDIGDGKLRRFFLGFSELQQIKRETGKGFYTLYQTFAQTAEPAEVQRVIRLAMIGAGEDPKVAEDVSMYYCSPPRPLKTAYLLAYECLDRAWAGTPGGTTSTVDPITTSELDGMFDEIEANMLRNGIDPMFMRTKSLAEIQALFRVLSKKAPGEVPAPDKEMFEAIKALHSKR